MSKKGIFSMIIEKKKDRFFIARLVALALTWAWGVVDGGIGLNALVKGNQMKSQIEQEIPTAIVPSIVTFFDPGLQLPINVTINNDDITNVGIVVATAASLIATACSVSIFFHLRGPLSPFALRLQGAIIAFFGVWLFAALIPYTMFFETRSAIIGVSVFGVQIPEAIVQNVQNDLGLQSQYSQLDFLQLIAILPWFTVIFSFITAIMLFVAASRVHYRPRSKDFPLEKGLAPNHINVAVGSEQPRSKDFPLEKGLAPNHINVAVGSEQPRSKDFPPEKEPAPKHIDVAVG